MMKSQWITALLLAGLLSAIIWREGPRTTFAADADDSTWGASDPTWSPDGGQLSFSLFGSIWTVPADGGEAVQVTSSAGYHAHPAWSPAGGSIAFVRGSEPDGQWPHISGKLAIVDLATGQEREIATPAPVSGTLAWSPDGKALAAPLGNIMHQVSIPSGALRRLQGPSTGVRRDTSWAYLAWNPKRPEIFFTGSRTGASQVWSIEPAGPALTVQMPLTRYGPSERVFFEGLSAVPDGHGVVVSANAVNAVGNYELYRVRSEGAAPVAITNTPRDEFSPAVSPDGKRIAFVSNALGNTDLFTMPFSGGEQKHVRLEKLKFRQPSGRLLLHVRDELGKPTAARVFVRASDGKAYCPSGAPIFYFSSMTTQDREGFFIAASDMSFPAPAGKVHLLGMKGVEYDPADMTVTVAPGETTEVTMQLRRWTNWAQRGWYSGENHIHANYGGTYYIRPKISALWMEAEDLNVANMTVANFQGGFVHDKEFFNGKPDPLSSSDHVLYYGEEYRNSGSLGHMAFLGIKKLVAPVYSGFAGSKSPFDFPLNTTAAIDAVKQGGLVSYVHPTLGERDVFDINGGAKEAPVGAAFGALDSFDVLPALGYDIWYLFLNSGFRIAPGAGTDMFTNWRGTNRFPGSGREYVDAGPGMDFERWLARYKQGRNFVTNGPLVSFNVNGEPMGAEIRVPAAQPYRARLSAEITWRAPLRLVEFIQNGEVIESRQVRSGDRSFRMEKEVPVSSSCWFAVRVTGEEAVGVVRNGRAHSGAVYVTVDGKPVLVRRDLETMIRWIDRLWLLLEEQNRLGPGDNRERARQMIVQARSHYEAKLKQVQ